MFKTKLTAPPADLLNWEVDRSNPLAPSRGLYVFDNGRVYNLLDDGDRSSSVSNGVSFGSDNHGTFADYDGTSSAAIVQSDDILTPFYDFTVIAEITNNVAADHAVISLHTGDSSGEAQVWCDLSSSSLRLGLWAGSAIYGDTAGIPHDGTNAVVAATANAVANSGTVYINGEPQNSGNIGSRDWSTSTHFSFGRVENGKFHNGKQRFIYVDDAIRTDAEIEALSHNVWQILKPRDRFFIVPKPPIVSGLPIESNATLSISYSKTQEVGIPDEINSALGITVSKTPSLGFPIESDSAVSISYSKTVQLGVVVENDSVLGITASKTVSLDVALETSSATLISHSKTALVGVGVETDSALALPAASFVLGIASELNSGFSITHSKAAELGLPVEFGVSLSVSHSKTAQIGLPVENDFALALPAASYVLGIASELDSGFNITASKTIELGLSVEPGLAFPVSYSKTSQLGVASETDSVSGITASKAVSLGFSLETNSAPSLGFSKTLAVGSVIEIDSVLGVRSSKTKRVGIATETDVAISFLTILGIGVIENESLVNVSPFRTVKNIRS